MPPAIPSAEVAPGKVMTSGKALAVMGLANAAPMSTSAARALQRRGIGHLDLQLGRASTGADGFSTDQVCAPKRGVSNGSGAQRAKPLPDRRLDEETRVVSH